MNSTASNESARDGRSHYGAHRRNISAPTTIASSVLMTPPLSPPNVSTSIPSTAATSNMGFPCIPTPAHLNLSMISPPYTQPVVAPDRHSHIPRPQNPYEIAETGSQPSFTSSHPPPDYSHRVNSFELSTGPASPVSPTLHPAYPLAGPGDESFFDRWLRHEAMGRPIFPGSRTGSSVATSDISSVRGGMFGSLPGGRATATSNSRRGTASVVSDATRDRDNFTSSLPSYPSSRNGASRPTSRDGDVRSINDESYAPSVVSSEIYPPSIDARLQYSHQPPPPAPTPPTSSVATSSEVSSSASVVYRDESAASSEVTLPENAATRPPRYSDSLATPSYELAFAELINNGVVGYQRAPIVTYGNMSAATEKALLAELNNQATPQQQGGIVMVREDVWQELRRRAGLDGSIPPEITATSEATNRGNGTSSTATIIAKGELNRQRIKEKKEAEEQEARCCGVCIIC
ncbi:hypothetical protein BDZ91DRAFT_47228 [Kalaharituber pfeilii]|nr:hypothetical protein BDZ91DRAFT_47228 [Kalaharituber pfeilii]